MTRASGGAGVSDRGALALVLHSHMPYVEGFGTWPFGEEWLWEALASVYLPLLGVLGGAPLTLGLTPVLCDQFETLPGAAGERFVAFLGDVRAPLHVEDARGLERGGKHAEAAEVRRAAGDYDAAARAFEALRGDVLGAFRGLAGDARREAGEPRGGGPELLASAATHPVLPLLATAAGRRLQIEAGLHAHERRFGRAEAFWLPECAYEPGLEALLAEQGVRSFCVDQTDALGLGSLDQLEPVATPDGPIAVPIDWQTVGRVWDERSGYPTHPSYRNYHGRTIHDLKPWDNAGRPYDHAAARETAAEHARDFLRRARQRLDAYRRSRERAGLLCCPLDTELLGHWWYEGPTWLATVIEEAPDHGVELLPLSEALSGVEPVTGRPLAPSTWGAPKDLTTWDSPAVAELAFAARRAELELVGAAARVRREHADSRRPSAADALLRAARELLALQASDWAFQTSRELAADYPLERARAHALELKDALAAAVADSGSGPGPALRNLAPGLDLGPLLEP